MIPQAAPPSPRPLVRRGQGREAQRREGGRRGQGREAQRRGGGREGDRGRRFGTGYGGSCCSPLLHPETQTCTTSRIVIAIYAPMIYMAPCVMFLMRADPLRGQVGGGWALEIVSFWAL